jgi:hypothetical protein
MVELGTTDFRFDVQPMPRAELRAYSTRLFDDWDERLGTDFAIKDYSIRLEIEEGSLNGAAVVTATLGALYYGIANYPSFIEGLQQIQSHVRFAADHLVLRAQEPFTRLNLKPRVARRTGVPGQLQRLFQRVKRRELDVAEAMREAERLLGSEAQGAPEFMHSLETSLAQVRRNPEQLILPMELPEEAAVKGDMKSSVRPRSPKEVAPLSMHLKVEVWRDSRTGKRQIRITEI